MLDGIRYGDTEKPMNWSIRKEGVHSKSTAELKSCLKQLSVGPTAAELNLYEGSELVHSLGLLDKERQELLSWCVPVIVTPFSSSQHLLLNCQFFVFICFH